MNIYVGNLPWGVSEEELKSLFGEYGQVNSAQIIMDAYTGKSKGFGFVEMPEKNEAEKAIQALNEYELKGRRIKVNEARPKGDRNDRGPRGGGAGGGRPKTNRW